MKSKDSHLDRYKSQVRSHLFGYLALYGLIMLGFIWLALQLSEIDQLLILIGGGTLITLGSIMIAFLAAAHLARPMETIQQAILAASDSDSATIAAKPDNLSIGRELLTTLVAKVYQLSNVAEGLASESSAKQIDLSTNFIANKLPLPMLVLNKEKEIVFANEAAAKYIEINSAAELIGSNAYGVFDMSFFNAFTLDSWLTAAEKSKAVATQTWERVKLTLPGENPTIKLFDLAAYYNKDNPNGYETVLVLFDHTDQYSQDDQAMSYVALSVHELRTPLTLLRGYIEVFRDELTYKIDPELIGFLHKMDATAQQLTYFVNTILNVARIERTGLELELRKEDWPTILRGAIKDMELRASVRGMHISTEIKPDLPPVGADRVSIYEVICNLLDNALKYSGESKNVIIRSYLNAEGLIETSIEDFGVGIPSSALRNLFDKFYRDHKKRNTIGGTGLGLYLSKVIINAHGGHIWVESVENKGSKFSFTVQPFDKLNSGEGKDKPITRSAHGWIKNHSFYRPE